MRVDQQVQLPFGEVAQLRGDERQQVGGECRRLAEEVPAVRHEIVLGEEQRVVTDAVDVVAHHAVGVVERGGGGADELRGAADAVGLLQRPGSGGHQAFEQSAQLAANLAGMRVAESREQARIQEGGGAAEDIDEQRRQ